MASVRTQKEIRQRAPIWLVTLLVGNLIIMAADARDADGRHKILRVWTQTFASPLQSASSKASGATSGFFEQIWNFRSTAQQNEQLKERLTQVEQELNLARQAAAENERLKALLNLKEQTQIQSVAARVIARDASVWFNTITINRGTSAGVAVNMPVVTGGGIVGRVIAAGPWSSQVMLITDEKAGAGAVVGQLGNSGALGSVRGRADLGVAEVEPRLLKQRGSLPDLGIGETGRAEIGLGPAQVSLRLDDIGLGLADVGSGTNALGSCQGALVDQVSNDLAELPAGSEVDALLADLCLRSRNVGDRYVGRLEGHG